MTGCQRLLANVNNVVTAATVSASSVAPASNNVFRQQTARAGNGQVGLTGSYTGADDATIEIEIRSASGTTARVTQPAFAGAGNGAITQPTATSGTATQAIVVTLTDLGTETTSAQAVIYGDVLLRAKGAGAGGNAISLTVTPALTLSASPVGALSFALAKDTQEWTDQRQDFGAVPLNPDGAVPDGAPRLAFGGDLSRVYRHYKRWDGEQWQYGISPKLAADHVVGATVHTVTGDYSVTITDGAMPETYAGVATLYDLLSALSASALVEVVGAVVADKKPGGMAAIDLPIRTRAFALPVIASDPERMPGLSGLTIATAAPTETVTVECVVNSPIGAETWAVKSKVSGALENATTGVSYTGSAYVNFTIPVVGRNEYPVSGRFAITSEDYANAETEIGVPAVCLYRPTLGAKASSKTLTLVWTPRPAGDCDCEGATVTGQPDPDCLGVDIEGEGSNVSIPAGYQTRLETLYGWRSGFVAANTAMNADGELRSAQLDIQFADRIAGVFSACLADLYADSDTPASAALTEWDSAMAAMDSDLTPLETLASESEPVFLHLSSSTTYSAGDVVREYVYPDDSGISTGVFYAVCIAGGTTSTLANFTRMPDIGDQLNWTGSGGPALRVISQSEAYAIAGGDAGDINSSAAVTSDPGIVRDPDSFVARYSARMDLVRAKAGLVPKSDAGSDGTDCWRDPGDNHYWQVNGGEYLPVFNNVYWHSCTSQYDPITEKEVITPTYEFGFGLRISCADRLTDGDTIVISISDVSANYPYQIGDTYQMPLIAGGPLTFAGGVTGTDTLTWSVVSSTAGALADYALDALETAYSDGGLSFAIHRGEIAFALGDSFTFSVETGGRFRWRKDSGAWSSDTALADTAALTEGLTAAFAAGAAPSFVAGDVYRFAVKQPNSPSHVKSAHGDTWMWSGSTAMLTLTWAADQTLSTVGVLRHGLVSPATVSIALKNSGGTTVETIAPTVAPGPLVAALAAERSDVRSIVVTVADATGLSLGWLYAGVPLAVENSARVTLRRAYALDRDDGINPRGAYLGAGRGGEISWEDWLLQTDFDALLALADNCKADGDAPLVLLPNVLFPAEAALVRIDSDSIDVTDFFEFQPNDTGRRHLSLTLPLAPVFA